MKFPATSTFQPVACFPPNRAVTRLLFLSLWTAFAAISFSACAQSVSPSVSPTRLLPTPLLSTPTPFPQPTIHFPLSTPPSLPLRPNYNLDVQLDYSTHFLRVNETITYPNQTGETLPELVLAVVPNDWTGFIFTSLHIDGVESTTHTLSGERLTVLLSPPLKPDGVVTLSIAYDVSLPPIAASSAAQVRPQVYGYSPRQINLIDWYPFIVPYEAGKGWLLHPPTAFGEYLAYDVADFDVTLHFPDAKSILVIASSGVEQPVPDPSSRRYRLEQGRAFAISASPEFQVASKAVGGVTVSSYYFPENTVAGQAVLAVSAQALQIYTDRFGPPPHTTLAAVRGDFEDGMEASAFYWLGQGYYDRYDGAPKNYLTIISAHETSHQWWFEGVGNDQALAPWLDESLAAYSEHVYYETAYPDLVNWLWDYRINRYSPTGWVDMAVTDAPYYEAYRKAVYLNGAKFMESLHRRLGDETFFAFLRAYTTQMTSRRATTDDFFNILHQQANIDVSDLRAMYFKSR